MAYENTHLFLAERMRDGLAALRLNEAIATHLKSYYLGSVFPDILFYSKDASISQVAYGLHGSDGMPTNRLILDVLSQARETKDSRLLAFAAGYLTHCAVDMTVHPVVYYYSGYHPQAKKEEQARSSYLHWHYETLIDKTVNDRFYLNKIIDSQELAKVNAAQFLGLAYADVYAALKRQIFYQSLNRSRFFYRIFGLLSRLHVVPRESIAGFYENLKHDRQRLPETFYYQDIVSGEPMVSNMDKMIARAVERGREMLAGADNYYCGGITREACEQVIPGENLSTGRVGVTTEKIRFSYLEKS